MNENEARRREALAIKLLCSVPHIATDEMVVADSVSTAKVEIMDGVPTDAYVGLYLDGGDSPIEGADSTYGIFEANMAEMLGKALIRAAVAAKIRAAEHKESK